MMIEARLQPTWIDAHNHLHDPRLPDPAGIVAEMKRAGVSRCVVNATRESDWTAVESLALAEPDFINPIFGIHPWQAHTPQQGWEERLKNLLEKHPQSSIGECGLDGWVSEPAMEIQVPVFIAQLRIARDLGRPLSIHALKAWEELFTAFAEVPPPPSFLMHSFNGSIEIARRLAKLGAYFSFSGHFLHPRKAALLEVFRQLPADRILLETDAPDMRPPDEIITHPLPDHRNHPANLPAIGNALAKALGMSGEALAETTRENFERCFA